MNEIRLAFRYSRRRLIPNDNFICRSCGKCRSRVNHARDNSLKLKEIVAFEFGNLSALYR